MKRLTDIELDEISLVDDPANQHAKVTLWKRNHPDNNAGTPGNRQSKEVTMTPDELEKKLGDLEKQNTQLQANYDALAKAAQDNGFEVTKADDGSVSVTKKADPEYITIDGEKFEKGAVPESVFKRISELEKAAEKESLAKRAKSELPNLPGSDENKGALLKAVDGLEGADEVMKSLKAADELAGKTFKEIGKTANDDENSATARLDKMTKEYAEKHGKTYHTAYAEVTKSAEGAKLMKESTQEAH